MGGKLGNIDCNGMGGGCYCQESNYCFPYANKRHKSLYTCEKNAAGQSDLSDWVGSDFASVTYIYSLVCWAACRQ